MFKTLKSIIVVLLLLAVIMGGASYVMQKNQERIKSEKGQSDEIQKTSNDPVQESHVNEENLYKAVYYACKEDISSVFAYDIKTKRNEIIFTDENKDYVLPCGISSDRRELIDGVIYFTAKDRKSDKKYTVSFDLKSKLEQKTDYDPYGQSDKDKETEQRGVYNVLISTLKKSPDGRKVMFVTEDQNLYIADSDYSNAKKAGDFTEVKCVNGGNMIDYSAGSRGWLTDKKFYFSDSGLRCTGDGDFLVDIESGQVSKFFNPLVYIPRQTIQPSGDFVAVVNSGNGNRIIIMNAKTGDVVQEIGRGTYVIVAPDNNRMFYESHPSEDLDVPGKLYVADVDGSDKFEVVPGADGHLYLLGWMK